ncbi:MAG: DNA repair protein RecO [Dehalococcoidia bacterium]|nr:DNA repair protein RecO [Dehalococcoidia bacterium]
MSHPRDYQTPAIIIKKIKLGEADRILTLYTPGLGKIQAVAKGVRRPKSKMAGHLELLTHSQVSLARGRNLDTITGAQTIDSFLQLKTDLVLTSYGLYIIELLNQFTAEHVEDEALFNLVLETLRHLCTTDNRDPSASSFGSAQDRSGQALLLRYFELKLVDMAGYRPQLHECVVCHKSLEPVINYFSANAGGMLCPRCAPRQPFSFEIPVNALKVLRFIQDNDFTVVSRLKINGSLSRELEAVTRHYLRYLLEREVKSAAWLDELREQLRQPNGVAP